MRTEVKTVIQRGREWLRTAGVAALSLITGLLVVWALAALIADGSQGRFLVLGAWVGFLAAVTDWGRKLRTGRR